MSVHLFRAARTGDLAGVDRALRAGADVNAKQGMALNWAARRGHLAVVDRLLAVGADVDASDGWPLRSAAYGSHAEVVVKLMRSRADSSLAIQELERVGADNEAQWLRNACADAVARQTAEAITASDAGQGHDAFATPCRHTDTPLGGLGL